MDPADAATDADAIPSADVDHHIAATPPPPSHSPSAANLNVPGEGGAQIQYPPKSTGWLSALPPELIASILGHLAPTDLAHAAQVCRFLYQHATDDRLWAAHVQDNVPGHTITAPYPCPSFFALFAAHYPRWFLTRHKIWFSDTGLAGRLIIARYDQRRGCIEAYMLVGRNRDMRIFPWVGDPNVISRNFSPELSIHLDCPILQFPAEPYTAGHGSETSPVWLERRDNNPAIGDTPTTGDARTITPRPLDGAHPPGHQPTHPFRAAIALPKIDYIRQTFVHAACLSPSAISTLRASSPTVFPYGNIWPPPTIPCATHHLLGAGLERPQSLRPTDRAASLRDVCHRAFRVYKWVHMPRFHVDFQRLGPDGEPHHTPLPIVPLGEEVSTYTTLPPEVYTPTPLRPLRGIWVGDYSAHGLEFLLMHQPDLPEPLPPPPPRGEGEEEEEYEVRCRGALAYSGRLEAIKLTGDSNVPRGEVSFVVEELGEAGTTGWVEGVRKVKGRGHVADNGFIG
ncbi:hypothetical protein C8A05DRAFT_39733, partial [Staphylotrichum tortipilum]